MKNLLKEARIKKKLKLKDIAQKLGIDQALVSKFEHGSRQPTRVQLEQLIELLELNRDEIVVEWLSEKILYEVGDDEFNLQAMQVAESKLRYQIRSQKKGLPSEVANLFKEIDGLKTRLVKLRTKDSYRIAQALELEYTYESNRIEGNTLTLKETDLVINEGITISGKSVREHLEAINHRDAVEYLKLLVSRKIDFKERDLLMLHNLILRGNDSINAGVYRNVQVMIKGSRHLPPQPYLVQKQMEELFEWYEANKRKLHPVWLAAELSERIVTIHPFIDGNGRVSRLVMNLILLRHGYTIANIKGDFNSRMDYYAALETAQTEDNKIPFVQFVANTVKEALLRYLKILGE